MHKRMMKAALLMTGLLMVASAARAQKDPASAADDAVVQKLAQASVDGALTGDEIKEAFGSSNTKKKK